MALIAILGGCGKPEENPADQLAPVQECHPGIESLSEPGCCIDERQCETVVLDAHDASSTVDGLGRKVSLEALCPECPDNLDEARMLTKSQCQQAPPPSMGCGVVTVCLDHQVCADYDAETGGLMGAQRVQHEYYVRQIDGCCGVFFFAGRMRAPGCEDLEQLDCDESLDGADAGM